MGCEEIILALLIYKNIKIIDATDKENWPNNYENRKTAQHNKRKRKINLAAQKRNSGRESKTNKREFEKQRKLTENTQ